jgi:nondiscriminating glutamyl-tRNA synthetase
MLNVRTRYAPSPTGFHHLGNLRTAVFAYLTAKHLDGTFVVRVEDTDQARTVEGSLKYMAESLSWLGIVPDEGVYFDGQGQIAERGAFGPYTQSKRLGIYHEKAEQLVANGHAYKCFCSSDRLNTLREEQQRNKQAPRYDRHCRYLQAGEVAAKVAAGESYVVRQAMPDNETVTFNDIIRGEISFETNDLDDQILLKSDGFPTYHLANIVDDHLMEITHVHRGEEWISSTPKNLLLYKAFGWEPPLFAHLPVILGPDKSKLSKRHGAEPILTYRDRGYLSEALVNVLAFIGWSPGTEEEFFTMDELVKRFQIEKVQKAAAVFDIARLDYVNGWYIRQLPLGEVAEYMVPYLVADGLITAEPLTLGHELEITRPVGEYLLTVAHAVQERLKHFDESSEASWFFFKRPTVDDAMRALIVPKKGEYDATVAILRESLQVLRDITDDMWSHDNIEEVLRLFISRKEVKAMEVLWPIRAALTGVPGSPGTFEMLQILGKAESLARIGAVVA